MEFLINNELWKLLFISPTDSILNTGRNTFTLGVTIPAFNRIYISNEIRGDLLHRVLCHELTHAEFISRGVYLPIYLEECLADITADNIVDVGFIAQNIHNNLCKYYNKC